MMDATGILKRLAPLRNQLLIFVVLGCIMINAFGATLSGTDLPIKMICGIVMHFISIPIFVGFGIFYAVATVKWPSSTQESIFEKHALGTLRDHRLKLQVQPRDAA